MTTFEEFTDNTIRQVWYSNSLGNRIMVCVRPKEDMLWYEVEMRPKGHAKAHTRKCYSFNYALDIANEEESTIYP